MPTNTTPISSLTVGEYKSLLMETVSQVVDNKLRAMQATRPPDWLKSSEARKLLGCGETTLRKLLKAGLITRNKSFKYSRASIEQYLTDNGNTI